MQGLERVGVERIGGWEAGGDLSAVRGLLDGGEDEARAWAVEVNESAIFRIGGMLGFLWA